jgi:hypothetical protein
MRRFQELHRNKTSHRAIVSATSHVRGIPQTEFVTTLQPSGYYTYHQVKHSQILRSAHTVYLCVLCGSQNKQPLFPYTALTDWFL